MPVRTLPDAELLVVDFLRDHADVAALVGIRITTELPPNPVYPRVTVQRIGGVPSIPGFLDSPRVEIAAWADKYDKSVAHEVARTVEAAMLELPGTHDLGVVTSVIQDGLGPRWMPDEPTDLPRYVMTFEFYVHP